jgi:hypothetical protein
MRVWLLGLAVVSTVAGCLPRKVLTQARVTGQVSRAGIPFVGATIRFSGGFAGHHGVFAAETDAQGNFRLPGEEGWRWYLMAAETEYRWRLQVTYEGTELARAAGRAVGDFQAPEALSIHCDVDRGPLAACQATGGGTPLGGPVE